MNSFLQTITTAPSLRPLFATPGGEITAGRVRATATTISALIAATDHIYLHTVSASLFVAGLLAAARKGVAVRCPAHLQPRYLEEICASGGVVLSDRQVQHEAAICLALAQNSEHAFDDAVAPDIELIFYTSGVTGRPKAVPKRICQLDAEAAMLESLWPGGARRVFGTVSHQHIYGMLFRIFWPLRTGGVSSDQPVDYWEELENKLSADTTLVSGPAHLTRLPTALANAKPRFIFSSGAPLPFVAAQAASTLLHSLPIEVLGSTETGGIAWRRQDGANTPWSPLPGVTIEANEHGELCVRSVFADPRRGVSTGDLVESEGGRFWLKGRNDCIVKIEGKRVSLVRIEEALLMLPFVEAAAAIDLPERRGTLGVIVQLNAKGQAQLATKGAFRLSREFRCALGDRLEPAERPKHWRFETIPQDRQGKRIQELLRAAFDPTRQELLGPGTIQNVEANRASIMVELTSRMVWFEGHFPGRPVLPGVALVHIAGLWAERVWHWNAPRTNLSRLKFRRVLQPGDIVQLTLERLPEARRLHFAYKLGEVIASEGIVEDDS